MFEILPKEKIILKQFDFNLSSLTPKNTKEQVQHTADGGADLLISLLLQQTPQSATLARN